MARHGEAVGGTSDTRRPAAHAFSLQRQRLNARGSCMTDGGRVGREKRELDFWTLTGIVNRFVV